MSCPIGNYGDYLSYLSASRLVLKQGTSRNYMNGQYNTDEDVTVRRILPPLKGEESFGVSEVRIIKAADPEKLKALHEKGKDIDRRRKAAGIPSDRNKWGGWK